MKQNNIVSWLCSAFTTFLAVTCTEEVMRIILLVLGVISAVVSLLYNLYLWYKKAKSDGKVTKEEIEEAVDIIKQGVEDIDKEVKKSEETNKEE